jgi:hypothetical protein
MRKISLVFAITATLAMNNLTYAQTTDVEKSAETVASSKPAVADPKSADKKMVQSATINLQTTITGNQEQPRVLNILPWQSPASENVDFESLENVEKSAFNHVEREELRRELESAGE